MVQVQELLRAQHFEGLEAERVDISSTDEKEKFDNFSKPEVFVAQPIAAKPTSTPKSVASLSQRLFKAAKETKKAMTKETFAVFCLDEGHGDDEVLEVLEVQEPGCKRLLSVCKGVTKEKLSSDHLDPLAVESIKACMVRILDKAGTDSVAGISCDVGYLWLKHQRTLRQAFPNFPVLTTPMTQLPFIWTCFGKHQKTLLVTWNDTGSESHDSSMLETLETAGIRLDAHRAEILTLNTSDLKWSRFLSGKTTPSEKQSLIKELVKMVLGKVTQLLDKAMGVNCIVLDSMLSNFSQELKDATHLPIFDEVSMLKLFGAASSLSHFSDANVLCRLEEKTKGLSSKSEHQKMGVVRLEHDYVAGVGDIDHDLTLSYESCSRVVDGLTFVEAQHGSQDPKILEKLKHAVNDMEEEGCFGITGNCGFMHFYQQFARDYATLPVFMSALVQVPTMAAALEPDERILILTANESSFVESRDELLSTEGRPFCDFNRVLVRGCEHVPGFEAVANADLVDNIKVQEHLGNYVKEILEQEKLSDKGPIKSILLECTQMPHYAAAIRQSTGLPVFDVVTCANFFADVLNNVNKATADT